MNMNHSLSLLFGAAFFACTGCVDVTFPSPMPENRRELNSFPSSWHGTWIASDQDTQATDEDDFLIVAEDRILGSNDAEELVVGEDIVLKRLGRKRIISFPQESGNRYSVVVAQRRGDVLEVRAFDPKQDGAINTWTTILGADQIKDIYESDGQELQLEEVHLNPKNTRQFRALLRSGTSNLVTYIRAE